MAATSLSSLPTKHRQNGRLQYAHIVHDDPPDFGKLRIGVDHDDSEYRHSVGHHAIAHRRIERVATTDIDRQPQGVAEQVHNADAIPQLEWSLICNIDKNIDVSILTEYISC